MAGASGSAVEASNLLPTSESILDLPVSSSFSPGVQELQTFRGGGGGALIIAQFGSGYFLPVS